MAMSLLDRIKAVVLDMDGLMIDSEPLHCRAYDRVLKEFGLGLSEQENSERYVGISDKDIADEMVGRYGLGLPAAELVRRKQEAYLELLRGGVAPQPGLFELLRDLHDLGLKKAIASSSMPNEIEIVMDSLRIRSYVEVYCSAAQVERGKPAPDLFLLAASKLSVPPESCLVLEDAPAGIAAARAAGMYSIAIPSRETMAENFSQADVRLQSLGEVTEHLRRSV